MMLSPVLDRENGDWVFLSWQLSLSCVMGVLACMMFVWSGSARWGIAAALLAVLLVWLIGEALCLKYISSLPSDEDQGGEAEKASKSWISLRKDYHTLDEDSYESRRSRLIARSTKRDKSNQSSNPADGLSKISEMMSDTMTDSTKVSDALVETMSDTMSDSPEEPDVSADDSVETTVIPMSEMQAYLRRLQDESTQGISR